MRQPLSIFLSLILALSASPRLPVSPSLFSSSTKDPGTAADDSAVGTVTWSDPSNALSDNATYTTAFLASATSHYLKTTNYGFAIPEGATIDGVTVAIQRKRSFGTNSINDSRVRLVNASGAVGTADKASGTGWPTTEGTATYGGAADTWSGDALIDWNDADAGAVLSVIGGAEGSSTASVDVIQITVTYTAAAPASVPPPRRVIMSQARTARTIQIVNLAPRSNHEKDHLYFALPYLLPERVRLRAATG